MTSPSESRRSRNEDRTPRKAQIPLNLGHASGSAASRFSDEDPLADPPTLLSQAADKRSSAASASSQRRTPQKYDSSHTPDKFDTQITSSDDDNTQQKSQQLKTLRKTLRRLTAKRDKILETRTKLEMEQKRCNELRGWVNESLEKIIELSGNAVTTGSITSSFAEMAQLHQSLTTDQANLKSQEATMKQIQTDLSNREYELMMDEKFLDDVFPNLSSTLGFEIEDSQYEDSESIEPPETRSEVQHPLAAEYYARKGEIGILMERLADVDYEYRVELADRDVKADQEASLDETESQFRRRFEDRRQQINVDIVAAETDTRRLEDECKAAGVELESKRVSSAESEDDHELLVHPGVEPQRVTYIVPGPPHHNTVADTTAASTLLTTRLQSETTATLMKPQPVRDREFVHQWLDDIASVPGSVSVEAERDVGGSIVLNDEAVAEQSLAPATQDVKRRSSNQSDPLQAQLGESEKSREAETAPVRTSESSRNLSDMVKPVDSEDIAKSTGNRQSNEQTPD